MHRLGRVVFVASVALDRPAKLLPQTISLSVLGPVKAPYCMARQSPVQWQPACAQNNRGRGVARQSKERLVPKPSQAPLQRKSRRRTLTIMTAGGRSHLTAGRAPCSPVRTGLGGGCCVWLGAAPFGLGIRNVDPNANRRDDSQQAAQKVRHEVTKVRVPQRRELRSAAEIPVCRAVKLSPSEPSKVRSLAVPNECPWISDRERRLARK